MKKIVSILLILLVTSLFQKRLFAQLDPFTNSYDEIKKDSFIPIAAVDHSQSTGINCNSTRFFSLNYNATRIEEFSISGINAVFQTVVANGANSNVAFCNNIDGGSFTPTFYSSNASNQPTYYNGTGWTTITTPPSTLFNYGGFGNDLVFIQTITYNRNIIKYNGTSYNTIYTSPMPRFIGSADLAVDYAGNIYFVSCPDSSTWLSDSLIVISQTGSRVASYPFVKDCHNIYGSFLLNGTYYLGLGPGNSTPNKLMPISLYTGAAVVGSYISMPSSANSSDLASCSPGFPLGVNNEFAPKELNIYPNPFNDETTISFNREQNNTTIKITDIFGKEIKTQLFSGKQLIIEKGDMKAGIYFLQIIDTNSKTSTRKIIVQ